MYFYFCSHLISLFPGLAKYAFDSEENLYTIMRKLCESTTIVNQNQTLPSSSAIHSKLTWSERVLYYAFATIQKQSFPNSFIISRWYYSTHNRMKWYQFRKAVLI